MMAFRDDMSTPLFVPYRGDVQQYLQVREDFRELNSKLVRTIQRQAFYEVGTILGLMRRRKLVVGSAEEGDVLTDACLFDWVRNGKNLIEDYAAASRPKPFSAESRCVQSALQAKYRIVLPRKYLRDAGVYVEDLLSREQLFLMDLGLSQSPIEYALAVRTIPMGDYWISSGAALPVSSPILKFLLALLADEGLLEKSRFTQPHRATLTILQTLLATGAGENVEYRRGALPTEQRRAEVVAHLDPQSRVAHSPGRNSPCPCGSHKRYKRCCWSRS